MNKLRTIDEKTEPGQKLAVSFVASYSQNARVTEISVAQT